MEKTKLVAFTFDDGPVPYAEDSTAMRILKTYEKYGQQATFFYWGEHIKEECLPVVTVLTIKLSFNQSIVLLTSSLVPFILIHKSLVCPVLLYSW